MSDYSQGPGWWQASDGKWYPPESSTTAPPASATAPPAYGAPAAGYGYAPAPKTNGFAIASLICSLVSCGIGSILAIVFGVMAKRQIEESNGTETGEGFATAGIIIGIIGLVLAVAYVIFIIVAVASTDSNDFNNSDFGMAALGLLTAR